MARKLADQTSDEAEGTSTDTEGTDAEIERLAPDKGLLNRRDYLRLGAATAAAATGVAATGTAAAASHRGISFNRVVNAVDDLGMDPNGNSSIDSKLSSAMRSNTLIEFPPGEYLVTEQHVDSGLSNFGIRGTGDSPSDAKFVFPSGNNGNDNYVMLKLTGANGLLLENFELHQTSDKRTGASFILYVEDKLEMHGVTWQGWNPVAAYAKGTCCYPSITSGSGVGHITNIKIRGGGVADDYPNRRMGFLMQGNHRGELVFKNLDIRELGSSALRGTKCPGAVKIEDSHFENNDNGSIRIGGGSDGQSYAKRCTVLVDGSRVKHPVSGAGYKNMDGIRMDSSGGGWSNALIEDCELIYREFPDGINRSRAAISRPSFGDHAGFKVRNCNIQIDVPNCPAVKASSPGGESSGPYDVVLENVHITGKQSSNPTDAVVHIEDSDGSRVEKCCINFPNGGLNGVSIEGSNGCAVRDSDIVVGGRATSFSGASVDTANLTSDGACRVPGDAIPDSGGDGSNDGGSDGGSSGDGSSGSDLPHTLEIRGQGTATNYSLAVEGDLEAERLESWDSNSGSSADGWVTTTSQVDVFHFSGGVTDFAFAEGKAQLTLNGQSMTATELGNWSPDGSGDGSSGDGGSGDSGSGDGSDGSGGDGSGSDGSDGGDSGGSGGDLPHTLQITGKGSATNYTFQVDGELAPGTEDDLELDSWDTLSGSSAEGWVTTTNHVDTYRFSGTVTSFEFTQGDAEVTLDGRTVSIDDFGKENTITIQGYGSGSATYEITASQDIVPHPDQGDLAADATPGRSVEDTVSDGTHAFIYRGEITNFSLNGPAAVFINGEQVDPKALSNQQVSPYPNLITVDGTGAGATQYEFAVSGSVVRSPDLGSAETDDAIDAGSVAGTIDGDVDGYRFTGNLTSMKTSGNVSITFEDNDG